MSDLNDTTNETGSPVTDSDEAVEATPSETQDSKPKLSLGARLGRVVFAAIWLGILGHLLALGSEGLLVESAKAKLNDEQLYPVMATLLGLMSVLWFLIPAFFAALVLRWMGRDALYIAPLVAMAIVGVGSVIGLKYPPPVTENVYIALFSVAVSSLLGALIAWGLARRKQQLEDPFYY